MPNNGDASFMQMLRGTLDALDARLRSVENMGAEQKQKLASMIELRCIQHDQQMSELFKSRNDTNLSIESLKKDVKDHQEEHERQQGKVKDYSLLIWGSLIGLVSSILSALAVWYITRT